MLLLLLQACVPYASPPLDLSIAADPVPEVVEAGPATMSPSAVEVRAGLVPLAVFERYRGRLIDPTAGVVASLRHPGADDGTLSFGGYGRVAVRPWRYDFDWFGAQQMGGGGPRGLMAAEPRVTVDVMADLGGLEPRLAGGFLVGGAFRMGSWTERLESTMAPGFGIGVARGEATVALALDAGLLVHPGGKLDGRFLIALEFRAPASAGLVVAPFQL